jgi:hypothetical protein
MVLNQNSYFGSNVMMSDACGSLHCCGDLATDDHGADSRSRYDSDPSQPERAPDAK